MKRLALIVVGCLLFASPVSAITEFHKQWKNYYLLDNPDKDFVRTARKTGCYICHVKGQKKEDVQNEYGTVLAKYLDADDFTDDWVKANPDEAKRRIVAAFKKVEEELSQDDRKFGDKIKNGQLPAIDSGI